MAPRTSSERQREAHLDKLNLGELLSQVDVALGQQGVIHGHHHHVDALGGQLAGDGQADALSSGERRVSPCWRAQRRRCSF